MFLEGTVVLGGPMLEQPVERTHFGSEVKCEEKGVAERSHYRMTTAPISHPTALFRRGQ